MSEYRVSRARIVGALVAHFFAHSVSRPLNWLVFVVAPAVAIVVMNLLLKVEGTGLVFFTIMLQACFVASLSVREKEAGVYHRILAAPVSAAVYSIALYLAVFAVVLGELVLVLGVTYPISPSSFRVGFPALLGVGIAYSAMAAAYGMAVTAFVSTTTQAAVLANVTVIFTSMISGCFWPLSIMPQSMQWVARLLPQTWANLALADLANGASSAGVSLELLVVLLYGAVFVLLFGLRRRRAG